MSPNTQGGDIFILVRIPLVSDPCCHMYQGPVVQSIVSLTTSLRVISLTVSADPIYNILKFFAEKM